MFVDGWVFWEIFVFILVVNILFFRVSFIFGSVIEVRELLLNFWFEVIRNWFFVCCGVEILVGLFWVLLLGWLVCLGFLEFFVFDFNLFWDRSVLDFIIFVVVGFGGLWEMLLLREILLLKKFLFEWFWFVVLGF